MDIAVIGASGPVGRAVCARILATGLLQPHERLQLVARPDSPETAGVLGLRTDLLETWSDRAPRIEPVLDPAAIEADVIIMAAGVGPSHDPQAATTPDLLARANLALFESYAAGIAEHGPGHETVLLLSDPVELAVEVFCRHLERHRVIGTGAFLDTLRFRREIGTAIPGAGPNPTVAGYVLGQHGPHAVPIWSSLGSPGIPAETWQDFLYASRGRRKLEDLPAEIGAARDTLQGLMAADDAVTADAFVALLPADVRAVVTPWFTHWSGGTSTLAAHAAVDVVAQIRSGHRVILPLNVAVTEDDWPGLETVLGIPVDVDIRGWHRTMAIHLAIDERKALEAAAAAINERLEAWQSTTSMGATA